MLAKILRGAALGALVLALGGCYVGPAPYAYNGGYYAGPGYYGGPGYYRPYYGHGGYGAPGYGGDYTNGLQNGR